VSAICRRGAAGNRGAKRANLVATARRSAATTCGDGSAIRFAHMVMRPDVSYPAVVVTWLSHSSPCVSARVNAGRTAPSKMQAHGRTRFRSIERDDVAVG